MGPEQLDKIDDMSDHIELPSNAESALVGNDVDEDNMVVQTTIQSAMLRKMRTKDNVMFVRADSPRVRFYFCNFLYE